MKKVVLLFVSCMSLLFLVACSTLRSGVVIGKHIVPAHNTVTTQKIGKSTYPRIIHHKKAYQIQIRGENKKGEVVERDVRVNESEYNNIRIGDYYEDKN